MRVDRREALEVFGEVFIRTIYEVVLFIHRNHHFSQSASQVIEDFSVFE